MLRLEFRPGKQPGGILSDAQSVGCRFGAFGIPLLRLKSSFEPKTVLLDHRVNENFPSDPFHFSPCPDLIHLVQREQKILALTHIPHALVLHSTKRIGNRLPLRIKNCSLQRNIDMSFH